MDDIHDLSEYSPEAINLMIQIDILFAALKKDTILTEEDLELTEWEDVTEVPSPTPSQKKLPVPIDIDLGD